MGLERDNRSIILEAAAAEFAERGFDGARVDAIARRAGVNKALIYYYFDNKEALLDLLFLETRDAVMGLLKTKEMQGVDLDSTEALTRMMVSFLDLLEQRQNVVRVIIMELSKRTPINSRIFEFIEEIMEVMFSMAGEELHPESEDLASHRVTEFFTGIMPLLDYVAYHELWMERYKVEESTLRSRFVRSFLGTHFAYSLAALRGGQGM